MMGFFGIEGCNLWVNGGRFSLSEWKRTAANSMEDGEEGMRMRSEAGLGEERGKWVFIVRMKNGRDSGGN